MQYPLTDGDADALAHLIYDNLVGDDASVNKLAARQAEQALAEQDRAVSPEDGQLAGDAYGQYLEAVEKARREGHPTSPTKGKTVQMTAEQYVIFERMQYEHIFLPAKMFEGGKEFMDRLAYEKEKLIDELYEEAYQQKRMYPYMEEDFSVMSMQISDTLYVT